MDYSKTPPHVCFKAEFALPKRADDELPRLFEAHLRNQFDSVKKKWMWGLAHWGAILKAGETSFTLVLSRSKYDKDEWIVLIGPNDVPVENKDSGEEITYVPQLVVVCRKIHILLTTTTSISAVRWYFEGPGSQSTAVITPDDLPWSKASEQQ